jgi:hypothetical protein
MATPIEQNKEDALIAAIHDICARNDLVASAMVNAVTAMMNAVANLNNTKNYYLELVGKLRQEKQEVTGESISSK